MTELCCSILSAIIFRLLFLFIIFQFGIVGATLGAIAGAMIGWSNKKRFVGGVILGAVYGTTLSYKLINDTFDYFFSDDADARVFLVNIVKRITGVLEKILGHEEHIFMGFNKASFGKGYSWADLVHS